MNRREFIRQNLGLGAGVFMLHGFFSVCSRGEPLVIGEKNFKGDVIIVGAGTAGLVAGYILKKNGIDFRILEASAGFGGRVKKLEGFSDFPIDLGAEWIHEEPSILSELLGKPKVKVDQELIVYNPKTLFERNGRKLTDRSALSAFYSEYKFKRSTWYDYLEKYVAPSSEGKIEFNSPVTEIDYSSYKVIVKTKGTSTFKADKVLLTVPISILKGNSMKFVPALSTEKLEALKRVEMPPGIKVFFEFSEKFFPDLIYHDPKSYETGENYKMFYDAAFKKQSKRNILGVFSTGKPAAIYSGLGSDNKIVERMISELDSVFDGKASRTYKKHTVQNWTNEPFILGSYSKYLKSQKKTMKALVKPLNNRVYFAGEAMNETGQTATVHGAGQSAYLAIRRMLKN